MDTPTQISRDGFEYFITDSGILKYQHESTGTRIHSLEAREVGKGMGVSLLQEFDDTLFGEVPTIYLPNDHAIRAARAVWGDEAKFEMEP